MKFEKRTVGLAEEDLAEQNVPEEDIPEEEAPDAERQPEQTAPAGRKKPVLTYILILFIAAFLLMAMSFVMHQRSNAEAITQLETSFNATIQDIQANQEKLMELEQQLEAARKETQALQEQYEGKLSAAESVSETQKKLLGAMAGLYSLQQEYSALDMAACQAIIARMEAEGFPALLENVTAQEGVTPPAQRYQQLKTAVENRVAAGY